MGRDGRDLIRWLWERCRSETGGTPGWDALVRTARKSGVSLAALLLAIQGAAGVAGCDNSSGDGDDATTPMDTVTDTPHGEDLVYAIMALDISRPEDTPIAILPPMDTKDGDVPPLKDVPTPEDTIYAIMPPMDVLDTDLPLKDVPTPEDILYPIMPMDIVPQDTPPPPDTDPTDVADLECKEDADCPEGMECDLPECPPGMFCILPPEPPSGVCVPEETTPTECWTDEDCPPGEECEGASVCPPGAFCILADSPGTCVEPPEECWTDDDCPPGEECVGASVCPPGAMCILPDSPGTCEPPPPPEKPGFADADGGTWRSLVEDAVRTFTLAKNGDDEPNAA